MQEEFKIRKIYSISLLLVILVSWELFCRVSNISILVIPPPSAVGLVLWDGLSEGYLWVHIWVTSVEMLLGLVIGCSFGWFGFGMTSTVIITALICFFPLLENTLTGIQYIPTEKRELFRMLGATRLQTLLKLKIPHGLPTILAGVRVSVVLALIGAVVGEFLSGQEGLGATIIAAQGMMDSALMFATFIIITFIGLIFYQLATTTERWLLRRHNSGGFNANP